MSIIDFLQTIIIVLLLVIVHFQHIVNKNYLISINNLTKTVTILLKMEGKEG